MVQQGDIVTIWTGLKSADTVPMSISWLTGKYWHLVLNNPVCFYSLHPSLTKMKCVWFQVRNALLAIVTKVVLFLNSDKILV